MRLAAAIKKARATNGLKRRAYRPKRQDERDEQWWMFARHARVMQSQIARAIVANSPFMNLLEPRKFPKGLGDVIRLQ